MLVVADVAYPEKVASNGLRDQITNAPADHFPSLVPLADFGGVPRTGIVGNQRIWFRKQQGISEIDLHPIQSQLLAEDLAKMIDPSFKECKKVEQK
jgi:hypothetical protein